MHPPDTQPHRKLQDPMSADVPAVFGLLVGGQARRMGGRAKGLLPSPDGPSILDRTAALCLAVRPTAKFVLVGEHPAYAGLGWEGIADAPPGVGPLGGLRSLLLYAQQQGATAVALASDMPFISHELLERLLNEHPGAPACAPSINGRWEPLFARYRPGRALLVVDELLAQHRHALHHVLDRLNASPLELTEHERDCLRDWDAPQDMHRR